MATFNWDIDDYMAPTESYDLTPKEARVINAMRQEQAGRRRRAELRSAGREKCALESCLFPSKVDGLCKTHWNTKRRWIAEDKNQKGGAGRGALR